MTMTSSGELLIGVQDYLARHHLDADADGLAQAVRAVRQNMISDADLLGLLPILRAELAGAGPLQVLLADPDTTDVVVNGPQDVRVDRGNGWETTDICLADEQAVQQLARRLASAAGRRLDDASPWVDGRLPDGTRLHAVLPPLAAGGTCLSLRVLRPRRHTLSALAAAGTLPGHSLAILQRCLAARLPMLITGGTGSGKTTLLGALLAALPPNERVICIEDAAELQPDHPHTVSLVARAANVEGAGEVTVRDLVRQALRMRPDRIVVGEVRGGEVVELLAALNTGHDGGLGTVHANASSDVPARLEALGALGGLDRAALQVQLRGALRVVVHLERVGQQRQVAEIGVLQQDSAGGAQVVRACIRGEVTTDYPLLEQLWG